MQTSFETIPETSPIMALSPQDGLSQRYRFLSTKDAVGHILSGPGDWSVSRTWHRKSRKGDPTKALHSIVLRSSAISLVDPRSSTKPMHLQCLLVNAHNGLSSFKALLGLFAMVCSNGLIVGRNETFEREFKHADTKSRKISGTEPIDFFNDSIGNFENFNAIVQDMFGRTMTYEERMEFAKQAAILRYGEEKELGGEFLGSMLTPQREEDRRSESTLWTTYNIVQEKIIGGWQSHGGFSVRKQRPIVNMTRSNDINLALWGLAKDILNPTSN